MKSPNLPAKWPVLFLTSCSFLSSTGCKPQDQIEKDRADMAQQALDADRKPTMEAQKAGVGVGIKGDSLDDIGENSPGNLIAAPVKAYFKVKERAVFEIQLPQMMQLYKATNGYAPKSHEDYMREVDGNRIQLPKLPDGMQYRYKPELEELWVVPIAEPAN